MSFKYKPFTELYDDMGWDDFEDHNNTVKNMKSLVSKEMIKRGKEYNNFYVKKEEIFDQLYAKYGYNAWNIEDAMKAGEDIFDGITF